MSGGWGAGGADEWGAGGGAGGAGAGGYGTRGGRGGGGASRPGADSTYLGLCKKMRGNLQALQGHLRKVTQLTGKLGTPKDTKAMRDRLQATLKAGFDVVKKMNRDLQAFGPCVSSVTGAEKNQRKIQRQKFVKDAGKLAKAFEAAAKEAVDREREAVAVARRSMSEGTGPGAGRRDSHDEEALIAFEAQEQDLAFNELIMDEREETIEEIQRNLADVRDTFVDLAHLVEEQGDDLDTMEWNITEGHARTERGVKHIEEASKHQKKYRKTVCWFMLVLLIVAGGVAVIIYLKTR